MRTAQHVEGLRHKITCTINIHLTRMLGRWSRALGRNHMVSTPYENSSVCFFFSEEVTSEVDFEEQIHGGPSRDHDSTSQTTCMGIKKKNNCTSLTRPWRTATRNLRDLHETNTVERWHLCGWSSPAEDSERKRREAFVVRA